MSASYDNIKNMILKTLLQVRFLGYSVNHKDKHHLAE